MAAELNGYLESYGYVDHMVGLIDPMKGRLPLMIIAVLYCALVQPKFSPDEPVVAAVASEKAAKAKEPLKPFQEYAGIIIFFVDALALMFASNIGLENWEITVIGALAMILFGVLKPREATASLPMSMLLLIVGALGMSRRIKRHRGRRAHRRPHRRNREGCELQLLHRRRDLLRHPLPADPGYAEPRNHADLPPHRHRYLRCDWSESGRTDDFDFRQRACPRS